MAELNTIINSSLFRTTTDGITGDYYIKVVDGVVTYEQKSTVTSGDHGELEILASTNTLALTASADLSNAATYVALNKTGLWTVGNQYETVGNATAGSITVNNAGTYLIDGFFTVSSDTLNTTLAVKYAINGTASPKTLIGTSKDIADTSNLSGAAIVTLNAGDVLTLLIAADKSCTATIKTSGISLYKIKPA